MYSMGGGSGYVMSKQAIRPLVEQTWPATCHSETHGGSEDVFTGYCLRKYLNVTGNDTRDKRG